MGSLELCSGDHRINDSSSVRSLVSSCSLEPHLQFCLLIKSAFLLTSDTILIPLRERRCLTPQHRFLLSNHPHLFAATHGFYCTIPNGKTGFPQPYSVNKGGRFGYSEEFLSAFCLPQESLLSDHRSTQRTSPDIGLTL